MNAYRGDVPGASVLVVRDGHVVRRASYGLADLVAHTPVTPQTNFRLASMSKQFTAAAIEILAARGKLSYDDPITRFLPSLPAYAQRITIRQLLTHSSGLLDYEDLIPSGRTEQVNDLDVLHLLENTDHNLVKLEMDLYWLTAGGQDPLAYFAKYPGRFPMVHIKDMVAKTRPDIPPDSAMRSVGKGSIDWKQIEENFRPTLGFVPRTDVRKLKIAGEFGIVDRVWQAQQATARRDRDRALDRVEQRRVRFRIVKGLTEGVERRHALLRDEKGQRRYGNDGAGALRQPIARQMTPRETARGRKRQGHGGVEVSLA